MTLEILISTIDNGINSVPDVLTTPMKGVSYLVSWQQSGDVALQDIPEILRYRDDVKVITIKGKGLSRNRNNAIKHATGDICLIADDDVRYNPLRFRSIMETFEEHPSLDVATFKYESYTNHKRYPSATFDISVRPRGYYVNACEIAFRRKAVQGVIEFNENFGHGVEELPYGETELFINDAVAKGMKCFFFPRVIVSKEASTENPTKVSRPAILMARGAVLRALYPRWRHIKYWFSAQRISRYTDMSFLTAYVYLLRGGRIAKRLGLVY